MTIDYKKQCRGCIYRKSFDGTKSNTYCHYILRHGVMRKRDEDGNCLSKVERKRGGWSVRRKRNPTAGEAV